MQAACVNQNDNADNECKTNANSRVMIVSWIVNGKRIEQLRPVETMLMHVGCTRFAAEMLQPALTDKQFCICLISLPKNWQKS